MSRIVDTVAALAEPIVQECGCDLWEVEYVKEAGAWYLRVYIDRPDGVSIDHCEAVSQALDPVLDGLDDLISGSYTFEVSSAGLERRLRGPSDFGRFSGHLVEVRLYKAKNGQKTYKGTLAYWDDDSVGLVIAGERHIFAKAEVAGIWLRIA